LGATGGSNAGNATNNNAPVTGGSGGTAVGPLQVNAGNGGASGSASQSASGSAGNTLNVNANNQGSASAQTGPATINNPVSTTVNNDPFQGFWPLQTNFFDPFTQFGNQSGPETNNPGPHDVP
jgi:hypothetical protein